MQRGQNQHVIKSGRGWAVRGEEDRKVIERFRTQWEAIKYAKNIAHQLGAEAKIHGRDGVIRDAEGYGINPFPPRNRS